MMQIPGRRYPSWIGEACSSVGEPYAKHRGVENVCLSLVQCVGFSVAKKNLGSIGEK